ncbi:hypothetical protein J6590_029072 [Homalodisca vitripennis]|nr:hypothetical protein J6590_029072 [Homalodisca vitripennis]
MVRFGPSRQSIVDLATIERLRGVQVLSLAQSRVSAAQMQHAPRKHFVSRRFQCCKRFIAAAVLLQKTKSASELTYPATRQRTNTVMDASYKSDKTRAAWLGSRRVSALSDSGQTDQTVSVQRMEETVSNPGPEVKIEPSVSSLANCNHCRGHNSFKWDAAFSIKSCVGCQARDLCALNDVCLVLAAGAWRDVGTWPL